MDRMSGVLRALLLREIRGLFEAPRRWRDFSLAQLKAFLGAYPRLLEQRPRITHKSGHSERTDTTPGSRPANTPAKAWMRPWQNDADRMLYYPFSEQPPFDG